VALNLLQLLMCGYYVQMQVVTDDWAVCTWSNGLCQWCHIHLSFSTAHDVGSPCPVRVICSVSSYSWLCHDHVASGRAI